MDHLNASVREKIVNMPQQIVTYQVTRETHTLLSRFFKRLSKDSVMNILSHKMDGEAFSETELDLMSDMLFSFYYGQITPVDRELEKMDDESRIL